ncbi:MAG: MaoC family dehydratase [Candidatus Rokuibacteriota bacterium]|jgi:acyl dehydratase
MIGLTMDAIAVGDSAQITRRVGDGDIASFVDAVGDYNPVHSDRAYAAATVFKEPIAPGIWTAGLISAVIGTRLPGPGAIYLSQDLKFLKPVKSGDSISARVEVIEVNREKNRIRLRTVCTNQRAEDVLTGEAVVMPSRTPIDYARPAQSMSALALWTLQPLAWMAQGATIMGMLGLSALSAATPAAASRPRPK